MGFRGNNLLHRNHFRKDWQRRVKTWFDQPGRKQRRRIQRQKKVASSGIKPTDLLRPAVRCPTLRYNTRLRPGRGFTFEELKAVGIPKQLARTIGIAVDHRRRNRSDESLQLNVERIKAYKDRLILFPRKAGKPKKGDSQASDLSAETTKTMLSISPSRPLEEPRPITEEEKEFQAYTTLRRARTDARLIGVRKIRAAKKEEEAAATKK